MSRVTPLVRAFVEHGRVDDCPIIDMHTHPDRFHSIYFPDPGIDGILRTMDRCNVRTIVMAPHRALYEPAYGNPWTIATVAAHPDRFRGYLCYNPHYPGDLDSILPGALESPGIVGFKVHPSTHQYSLAGDAYQPLFAWAEAHRLLVLSHTWNDMHCGADACRRVAERYPELRLLLGHSCWNDWDGAIAIARDFPHVYLELTAAERMPGFIERAVREAGPDKVLFGTDLPWFDPNFTLGCVLFADIDDDARHAILHGNAKRLLAPWRASVPRARA